MAISTATAIIGGALIGGATSLAGAKKASDASKEATGTAVGESRRQFDLQRQDMLPFIETGHGALAQLAQLYGINRDGTQGTPDFSAFTESPGYQFRQEEGQQAIDRSLAARGKALSGQGVKEGQRYASGLASQEFGSFFDRLATLAGIGNTGAAQSAAAGATSASQVGNAVMHNGVVQANARTSAAAGINSAIQGGLSNYLLMQYLGNGSSSGLTLGAGGPPV